MLCELSNQIIITNLSRDLLFTKFLSYKLLNYNYYKNLNQLKSMRSKWIFRIEQLGVS